MFRIVLVYVPLYSNYVKFCNSHYSKVFSEDFEGLLVSSPIHFMNPFYIIIEMVTQSSFHTSRDREIITSQSIQ